MTDKKLPYALHGSTHIVSSGKKLYVNPSDLVDLYGLTEEDEYVFFDYKIHKQGDYIHLKATPEHLERLFPEDVGEFRFD